MGELGKYAENAHREVLELALEKGLNVITVGPLFHQAAKNHPTVHSFMSTAELKAHLKQSPLSGHHVLLKGSRSIALEEALGAL